MENNDILRRLRYTFDFGDSKMINLFKHVDVEATRTEISDWLKRDDDADYKVIDDPTFSNFLNGFIIEKRGKKEDGQIPEPEKRLSNNIIFTKIKIALNLKADDVIEILNLASFSLSNHELSAFFRKPGHKNYRKCQDQVLRYFLQGLQIKYKGDGAEQ